MSSRSGENSENETRVVYAGSRRLEIRGRSFLSIQEAITQQIGNISDFLNAELQLVLQQNEHENEYYGIESFSANITLIASRIVRLLKTSIEIVYDSGRVQIFPYSYQIDEPVLRFFCSSGLFYSVKSVSYNCDLFIGRSIKTPKLLQSTITSGETPHFKELKVGSWNTRGGSTAPRRLAIDAHCMTYNLDVICLQDVQIEV